MMSKGSPRGRKTTFKIFVLQLLWIGFFIISILGGISDLILYYDIRRLVLNVLIILSGLVSLLAEAYCFKFYSYMLFIYTPIGRGLFMVTLSCLNLNDNLYSLIISVILFLNSMLYFIMSAIFGGINKPLFNDSLKHELNLSAKVYFINNNSNPSSTHHPSKLASRRHHHHRHQQHKPLSHHHHKNHHQEKEIIHLQ